MALHFEENVTKYKLICVRRLNFYKNLILW